MRREQIAATNDESRPPDNKSRGIGNTDSADGTQETGPRRSMTQRITSRLKTSCDFKDFQASFAFLSQVGNARTSTILASSSPSHRTSSTQQGQ